MSLSNKILLGVALGVLVGIFFGDLASVLKPVGDIFIMLLQLPVLIILICAIVIGIGGMKPEEAGEIGKYSFVFAALFWGVSIGLILLSGYALPSHLGAHYSTLGSQETEDISISLFIPVNIFQALANEAMPAVVIFCIALGIALIKIKNKDDFLKPMQVLQQAMLNISSRIIRLSPIGVFAITGNAAGTVETNNLAAMQVYLYVYAVLALLLSLWVIPGIISIFTPISIREFFQPLRPALLLSFTAANSFIALPMLMEGVNSIFGSSKDKKLKNEIDTYIPIILKVPLVAQMFPLLFAVFTSWFYVMPITLPKKLTAVSMLIPLGFVTPVMSIPQILSRVGLPVDFFDFYFITNVFTIRFRELMGSAAIAGMAILVIRARYFGIKLQFKRVLLFASICFVLGVIVFEVFSFFPGLDKPFDSYSDKIVANPLPCKVHLTSEGLIRKKRTIDEIQRSRVIKIGYNGDVKPFSYFNSKSELVGYDIEFAHELARDLGCRFIEFIPFRYRNLINELSSGLIDIAMSSVVVNHDRLSKIRFSNVYLKDSLVFVTLDEDQQEFKSIDWLHENPQLKIAVLSGSIYERQARKYFSKNHIIPISKSDDFEGLDADAFLWREVMAIPWILKHPRYSVAVPQPRHWQDGYAYAMGRHNEELAEYVNSWLAHQEMRNFKQSSYLYWVAGQSRAGGGEVVRKRWSILRNVLGYKSL